MNAFVACRSCDRTDSLASRSMTPPRGRFWRVLERPIRVAGRIALPGSHAKRQRGTGVDACTRGHGGTTVKGRCTCAMKIQRFILLAMVSIATICRSENTNSFGIYLTAEPVDALILAYGKGDWSHVKIQSTPVISESDILVYDFTKHWVTLKPEVLKRLPRPSIPGTPFVVVANDERIYLGAFTTPLSSSSVAVPSIIIIPGGRTSLPPDTLQIDRAYPPTSIGVGPDPRFDERIKRALAALHKLK